MRSGKIFFVLSLTLLVGLAAWSCSDTPTAPTVTEQEQNYQAVQTEVNEFLDTALTQITYGLRLADASASTDTAIIVAYSPINPDSVSHDAYWTILYASDLATAYNWNAIDSLQFRKNGLVQGSAEACDAISLRHHFSFEFGDTTGSFRNRQGNAAFEFSGLNTQTATINGVRSVDIQTRVTIGSTTWRRNFSMNMNFNSVTVSRGSAGWQKGCPNTGSMTGTVTVVAARDTNTPTETTWTYEVTFDSGVATASVTNGLVTKTYVKTICQ